MLMLQMKILNQPQLKFRENLHDPNGIPKDKPIILLEFVKTL